MRLINKPLFSLLFLSWILLTPLIFINGAYEGAKVLIFTGGGLVLTVFWLFNLFHGDLFIFNKSDYWYWLWLAILLLSSILGVHPFTSIIGGDYRHQGILFFLTLWLTGKTVVVLNSRNKSILKNLYLPTLIIESFVVISDNFLHFSNWNIFWF